MSGAWLLIPILLPTAAGLLTFTISSRRYLKSMLLCLLGAEVLLAIALGAAGTELFQLFDFGVFSLVLRADALTRLFSLIVTVCWLGAGLFALRYMEHEQNQPRFFAFYLLTLGALMVICYAANLVTLYLGYEAMTLLSLPLVFHTGTKAALNAGIKYLGYSVLGAGLGLAGILLLQPYGGGNIFRFGGMLFDTASHLSLLWLMLCIGFGCKAGMYPLHGWLPTAHPVAPAPASAVLSGVITKMGVLAILRVSFYVFSPSQLRGTTAQAVLLVLSLVTVFLGSMLAYKEPLLKKRLAWSTVSQVSYVLFGIFLLSPAGLMGALLQLVYHACAKNGLFLSAGAIIFETGETRCDALRGIGLRMPEILLPFTLCALSLIGIPPTGGFFSKWYLASAALESTAAFPAIGLAGVIVLLISAILTAGYLLPICLAAFFPGDGPAIGPRLHPTWNMVLPVALFALAVLVLGLFPAPLTTLIASIF